MAAHSSTATAQSPFALAIEDYIKAKPPKSKTSQVIRGLQKQLTSGTALNKKAVQDAMQKLEQEATDRDASRRVRKVLKPIVSIMGTYTGVIDSLSSADPMPTALVWGALKAVFECGKRFLDLY